MTKSTPRTGLSRAAATLLAFALATGWSQSGPVLAHSTVESVVDATGAPFLADPREAVAATSSSSPLDIGESHRNIRTPVDAQAEAAAVTKPAKTRPAATQPAQTQSGPTYSGRNRFWIPSLDMNYKVHLFECTRSRDPDNYIYRWGCAGANNVYILGHAYSVMKPLHDLYVAGRLRKGMVAIYADGAGRVHWYRVTEWRVVDPAESAWAIADQPVPSMTMQTCVGKDGRYRLNVRLVQYKVT